MRILRLVVSNYIASIQSLLVEALDSKAIVEPNSAPQKMKFWVDTICILFYTHSPSLLYNVAL